MKLWQAFAAAFCLIRLPGNSDHVERVDAALRRADVLSRRKIAVSGRVVASDAKVRERIERDAETIRSAYEKRKAVSPAVRFSVVRQDIEAMLASLDPLPKKPERPE